MRVDINTDRAVRLRVRDVLVDGEPMPRGSVLTADEERGFVEKVMTLDASGSSTVIHLRTCRDFILMECLVGKVEILTDVARCYA